MNLTHNIRSKNPWMEWFLWLAEYDTYTETYRIGKNVFTRAWVEETSDEDIHVALTKIGAD